MARLPKYSKGILHNNDQTIMKTSLYHTTTLAGEHQAATGTGRQEPRRAESELGSQPDGECWRVLHKDGEQSDHEAYSGLITDEVHLADKEGVTDW